MVFAPAKMVEVGIAPRHAPMLTPLSPGEVRVQDVDGKEEIFLHCWGCRGSAAACWSRLSLAPRFGGDQVEDGAALAAQHEAEEALQGASEETDLARAHSELAEARARYRAAQKLKGKR